MREVNATRFIANQNSPWKAKDAGCIHTSFQEQASQAPCGVPSWSSLTQPVRCTDEDQEAQALRRGGGGGRGDQPAFDHRAVTSFHLLVLCMLPTRFAFCELVASRNIKDVREPKPLRCEVFSVDVFLSAPLLSAVMPGRPHQIALFCQPPAVCGWKKNLFWWSWLDCWEVCMRMKLIRLSPRHRCLVMTSCKSPASPLSRIHFHSGVSSKLTALNEEYGWLS